MSVLRCIASFRVLAPLLALSMSLCAAMTRAADTDRWPAKSIKVILPFAPGAATDIATRRMAAALSPRLGQSVYVENKTGGMGTIGVAAAAREKPDGYTLTATDTSIIITPFLMKDVPYDAFTDLIPIVAYVFTPLGIVVNANSPYKSVQDLIGAAKAQPNKITFGSGGAGSSTHLAAEAFAMDAGIALMHIPYKGAAEGVLAVLSGTIVMQFASPATTLGNLKAGKLRMLVLSGEARSKILPDVPTFPEAGLKNSNYFNWIGLWTPKGTPAAVVERLRKEVASVMSSAEMVAFAREIGADPRVVVGDDFAQLMHQERNKWKAIVTKIGLEAR